VNLTQLSGLGPGSQTFVGLFNGYNAGLLVAPLSATQRQLNFVDTIHFTWGRHRFELGIDYRRLTPIATQPGVYQQYLYFDKSSVQANSAFTRVFARIPAYPLYTTSRRSLRMNGDCRND